MHRWLTLLSLVLLAALAGGCSDSNSSAPPPNAAHPAGWILAHPVDARANLASCRVCHGIDFRGSGAAVACFACHVFNTVPPFTIHPADWDNAVEDHQAFAAANGFATCAIAACHGVDLRGGSGSSETGPSCFAATFTNDAGQTSFCHPGGPPGAAVAANEQCQACHQPGGIQDVAAVHGLTAVPATLTSAITSVIIANAATTGGQPTVFFNVQANGVPVTTLTAANVSFTIAKLVPRADGSGADWQSYVNRTQTSPAGRPGAGTTARQADREQGTRGILTNLGGGNYSYIFAANLSSITTPLAVSYEPALTHRVAIQFAGQVDVANPSFTFRPSDGATTGIASRDIAVVATCNVQCHGRLAEHGGGRIEIEYCVTCHNPGPAVDPNIDPDSGNTIDLKVLIHKIHHGRELPSVLAGSPYFFWGGGTNQTRFDFSGIGFPQDIRHCTNCHRSAATGGKAVPTTDGDNWKNNPSIVACSSCHDNISFVDPPPAGQTLHSGGAFADSSSCSGCHPPDTGGVIGVAEAHAILAQEAADDFRFEVLSVTNTAPGQAPTVTFRVFNPNTGVNYDIKTDPAFGSGASLTVRVGWPSADYTNVGAATSAAALIGLAQPININALTASTEVGTTDTFSVTFPAASAIPATVTGSGAASLEGRAVSGGVQVPIIGAVRYFPITDATAAPRRQVVDQNKCLNCHDIASLALHGTARTVNPELCVICHNADATDFSRRPAFQGNFANFTATGVDGKREEAIDFKTMIHALHGNEIRTRGIVIYGFGNVAHNFGTAANNVVIPGVDADEAIHFPNDAANCDLCHISGTFTVPLRAEVLATTVQTADPTLTDVNVIRNALATPVDDLNITRTSAVCSSCHDSSASQRHMEIQGGNFSVRQLDIPQ